MFDIRKDNPPAVELSRAMPPSPTDEAPRDVREIQFNPPDNDRTHRQLMDCLDDEGERQAEERYQMAIDEDYNDHRHWRAEDAQVLLQRGQAPLVYNAGRQTIEWLSGTEKRMRKDFKVLPREPDDEQNAEVKQHLLKYTDDANFTQWHRSHAFKRMCVSGLWWLEEGLNPDPEQEIIYSGSEDWKNVLRDSRGRDLMLRDYRYIFRRKRLDLDYAYAMMAVVNKERARILLSEGYSRTVDDDVNDMGTPWYLGEQLTNASEAGAKGAFRKSASFDERSSFLQSTGYYDNGRRMSVDIIETFYRVPISCEVFVGGMFDGRIYNEQDPRHRYLKRRGVPMRAAVRMKMHTMISTERHWLWNGPSPFTHNRFTLIPLIAYQRARDGQIYGVWRGMRDLSDDTNKRRAKALWALSSNRVIVGKDSISKDQSIDIIRHEAAQPDGVLLETTPNSIRTLENQIDVQGNLAMAEANVNAIREMGGVTAENLGYNTAAQSGKAIIAKQEQGALTTSDLFDNYVMAIKIQGMLRLSHIEQCYTQRKALRIVGRGKPFDWIVLNEYDPETGEFKNDVTQRQADFEVDVQDFRASLQQAGLESMFNLLGQLATFAPQVVLHVLDLVVEAADLPQKQEWVTRIRAISGQRDPSKAPTPEEMQQDAIKAQKQAKAEAIMELTAEAELAVKQATARDKDASAQQKLVSMAMEKIQAMLQALEGAIVVTNAPHVVPAADAITEAADLPLNEGGTALGQPGGGQPMPPQPAPADPAAAMPPEPGAPQPAVSVPQ